MTKQEKVANISYNSFSGFQELYTARFPWLGCGLKDGPAQCTDKALCLTGTALGTARRPHFSLVIIT
jgi:hypothetical protein